jgi:Kef-type K+ transport system membrane component KefB
MSNFLQFAMAIAIIIVAAKAGGYISLRLGQPSVLGELVAGLVLGPSVLNLLHLPFFTDEHLATSITHLGELGVIWLMFVAGLELDMRELLKSGGVAALAGILGVVVPLGAGTGVAMAAGLDPRSAVFVGLILSATSVSISAQTLIELRVLRSRVGLGLLGAAVFDDILVILFLSIFVAIGVSGAGADIWGTVVILLRMIGFLVGAVVFGLLFLPRLAARVSRLPISQGIIAFVVVTGLFYALAAELLGGMAAITGAFLAGLLLADTPLREEIEEGMATLAYGFFVPIFLVNIGLETNVRDLQADELLFTGAIILVAVLGKILGSGLGARIGGFTRRQSLQLGIGMVSRGEVGLIVASVGILEEVITAAIFSEVVVMVIVTTLITPPLLRLAFAGEARKVSV